MLDKFLKKAKLEYDPDMMDTCLKIRAYSLEEGRQDLINKLQEFLELVEVDIDEDEEVISIEHQKCGCRLGIKTIEDIPYDSVYCKHGNGMIVYEILTKDFNKFKNEILWDSSI